MATYRVTWDIDTESESPKKAAIEALSMQQDPFSEALAFTVTNLKTGRITEIDLLLETP